ncbi:MAG: ATP-binding protein [Bacteriovoracia bacterium]
MNQKATTLLGENFQDVLSFLEEHDLQEVRPLHLDTLVTHRNLFIKSENRYIPVSVNMREVMWEDRPVLQATIRDMTEEKKLEKQLKMEAAHIRLLEKVSSEANQSADVNNFISTCIQLICKKFSWDFGHVFSVRSINSETVISSSNIWHEGNEKNDLLPVITASVRTVFRPGQGLVGRVFETQKTHFIEDVESVSECEFVRRKAALECGIKSICSVPVIVQDRVTHILEFFSMQFIPFSEMHLHLLEHTTTQISRVIERHEAQIELQRRKEEVLLSSRMAELGLLSSSIAHEINNPLQIISVKTAMMMSDLSDDSGNKDHFKRNLLAINSTVERINKVIHGLKALSRGLENDPFSPIIFNQLLQDTLGEVFENYQNLGIDFQVSLPDLPVEIECRGTQISQVIVNLIGNAVEAVKDHQEKWIRIEVRELKEGVEFSVTDSGPGISSEVREKIFDAFFTTRKDMGGTGLGLNISKTIVESHQGKLHLEESSPLTKFIMWLPGKYR